MCVDAGDDIELVTRRCNEQRLIVWGYPNGKDSNWLRFAKWNAGLTTITVNDPCGGNGNVLFFRTSCSCVFLCLSCPYFVLVVCNSSLFRSSFYFDDKHLGLGEGIEFYFYWNVDGGFKYCIDDWANICDRFEENVEREAF